MCAAGPARHGIYDGGLSSSPPNFLLPGAVAPHLPFFLAFVLFVWSCGRVGFLVGCLSVFPLVFRGGCWGGLVNSVGLRGYLLGWGECAWAVKVYSLLVLPLGRGEQWGYLVEVVGWETYN